MKQSWKVRLIFIIICLFIMLYLGFERKELLLKAEHGNSTYNLVINEVMADNRNSIRDEDGDFEDWIEIYNKGELSVSLKGFGLTNDSKHPFLWTFPDITIKPKAYIIVWASEKNKKASAAHLHTSFKLKNKDKAILLTAPNDSWKDIFVLKPMGENISYGRLPDGSSELYGFDEGTPGRANNCEALIDGPSTKRLNEPLVSSKGGFYTKPFELDLSTADTDAEIYYTLDGSAPTKKSERFSKAIPISPKINEAAVVRAIAYKEGYPKSGIVTQSYFVGSNINSIYNTPVISLVTDPQNLFDYKKGIYIAGRIFDQWRDRYPDGTAKQLIPANYNQRGREWEREGSIELFESDGSAGLIQDIGIRVHGGYSRANSLKPLMLFARTEYDDSEYFIYNFFAGKVKSFFDDKVVNRFSHILLRTSATDSKFALFRDAFMQSLVEAPVMLDTQASQPCILFINGKYYGIHNIREFYDKTYIKEHYNVDEDAVVILKNPTGVAGTEIEEGHIGDEMHFNRVIAFVQEKDLKSNSNYDFIKTQIDIDNFIDYNILQIYCDNRDWPGNNVLVWRKRTKAYEPNTAYGHDGRWRWMPYDLDYGFGLYVGEEAAKNNSLQRAVEKNGPDWPNPPWSTLLLRSLLQNQEFKYQFINTFADRLNTIFIPEAVVRKIEAMEKIYYPNIETHIIRWNLHDNKVENWLKEIEGMKAFAKERPGYMRQHIVDYFGLSGTAELKVDISEGGAVRVNSLVISYTDTPWTGVYFKDIPIEVEAVPKPGYIFTGWQGVDNIRGEAFTMSLSESKHIKAAFERVKSTK